jgi:hypothetical protein
LLILRLFHDDSTDALVLAPEKTLVPDASPTSLTVVEVIELLFTNGDGGDAMMVTLLLPAKISVRSLQSFFLR